MNEIVQYKESRVLSAADIRAQVNLVQEVMKAVMKGPSKENKDGVHYGTIPGTKKPSLYKAGAEVLCATFRIADRYEIEDLTVDGMARFRVRCIGTHQGTGIVLGEGMGECSSHEEKYKWRAAICNEEFEATPENLRRLKFSKWDGKVEKKMQVRTESADQANTILKMACKRAKIAMTLNVTAASDIFTQDIEDLPAELRHDEDETQERQQEKPAGPQPYPAESFDKNLPTWTNLIVTGKKTAADIIKTVSSKAVLSDEQKKKIEAVKKPATIDHDTGEISNGVPAVNYESLLKRLQTFTDVDVGDTDASLIGQIDGQDRQNVLAKAYQTRRAELVAQ